MKLNYNQKYFQERDLLIPHLARLIKNQAQTNKLHKILDVGCGTGRLVKYLNQNGFEASGCDNATEAVKKAIQLNSRNLISKASANHLPFTKNSFDLVTAISVIEHLNKKQAGKFLKEAKRVLKPKGFIFLVTPNFATPLRIIQGKNWFAYSDPTHINFFTPKSLIKIMTKNNFSKPKLYFKIKNSKSLDWEFPRSIQKFPRLVKNIFIYLVFTTPVANLRNSIWLLAQKDN